MVLVTRTFQVYQVPVPGTGVSYFGESLLGPVCTITSELYESALLTDSSVVVVHTRHMPNKTTADKAILGSRGTSSRLLVNMDGLFLFWTLLAQFRQVG